jgi:tRNA(Arg) A34 adenosine deaminase TadA
LPRQVLINVKCQNLFRICNAANKRTELFFMKKPQMNCRKIEIELPVWVEDFVDWNKSFLSDAEKMSLTIALAEENVRRKTGGPFGAAIFQINSGKIVSAGINQVVRLKNSCLHAEITAIMLAQAKLETFTLNQKTKYELFASCEPCAMCLGAILWSGASRLVCAATKQDALKIGFDEGPVYESSYKYLQTRGIEIIRNFLSEKAIEVFNLYKKSGGVIYNR